MVFSSIGAAYGRQADAAWCTLQLTTYLLIRPSGTAKSGVGIAGMGQFKPALIMKALIPVVMASIIGVYGLVVAVLISGSSMRMQRACCRDLRFIVARTWRVSLTVIHYSLTSMAFADALPCSSLKSRVTAAIASSSRNPLLCAISRQRS